VQSEASQLVGGLVSLGGELAGELGSLGTELGADLETVVSAVEGIATEVGAELVTLLVPTEAEVEPGLTSVETQWDASTPGEAVADLGALVSAAGVAVGDLSGSACGPKIGFDSGQTVGGYAEPGFGVQMPGPSPCPGNGPDGSRLTADDDISNMFGYRDVFRGVAEGMMIVYFLWWVASSMPWLTHIGEFYAWDGRFYKMTVEEPALPGLG
jgi:hypothetical protein